MTASTLNEVNQVVSRRIAQLQADIAEAEGLLASYRDELEPLLKIAAVASNGDRQTDVSPAAPSVAVIETPAVGVAPMPDTLAEVIPSRRWSHFQLPPRYRRFIDRFYTSEKVTRDDMKAWYKRLNPSIQPNSLDTVTGEIVRHLTMKRILKPCGENAWTIVR